MVRKILLIGIINLYKSKLKSYRSRGHFEENV